VAFSLLARDRCTAVYAAFNPHGHTVTAALPPPLPGASWRLAADTGRAPPDDAFDDLAPLPPFTSSYDMAGKAALLLVADAPPVPTKRPASSAAAGSPGARGSDAASSAAAAA